MSAIFHHAMRYEWVDRNPIKLVRQSSKRERTPEVHASRELEQTGRTKQGSKDDGFQRGNKSGERGHN